MKDPEQISEILKILAPLDCLEFNEMKITLTWLVLRVLLDHRARPNPLDDLPKIPDV